jgi:predicted amidohydrolase YtcJ
MASTRIDPFHPERGVFNERERLTIEELIPTLTMNGARLMNLDEISGSIEVDKSADLVVLDRNILECLPEEFPETRVLLTLLEGRPVYHAEDSPMLRSAEGLKTTDMWR